MAENYDYNPSARFASDADIRTNVMTLATGNNLAALTPLKKEVVTGNFTGKLTALTGVNDQAVAVLVNAVDASAADVEALVYTAGDLFLDVLVGWPAGINTNALKKGVFLGTPIQAVAITTGQAAPTTY